MRFEVLGSLAVTRDGASLDVGSGKQRLLLAALVLHPNEVISTAELTELLWDDDPPLSAPANLRTYVRGLRKVLGADRIPVAKGGYLLTIAPDERDLDWFDERVARGRAALADGRPDTAAAELAEALGGWRTTPALSDLPQTPGLRRLAGQLEERRLLAEEEYADALLATGATSEVIVRMRTLLSQSPLRQRAWRSLMLALYRAGDVAGALGAYGQAQQVLAEQTGLDPSPDLVRLHDGILQQDAALLAAPPTDTPRSPTATATALPARAGLDPAIRPEQLPASPHYFVGRERQLAEIDRFIAERSTDVGAATIIALSGMPGVGKTSLGLRWANGASSHFPGGRLYIDLRGYWSGDAVPPEDALLEFLESLGVTQDRIPSTLGARSALFRSIVSDRQMLVFLDNARDEEQVRPLLPGAGPAVALITSRSSLESLIASDDAHTITVGELDDGEAEELWAARLGAERLAAEPTAARKIGRAAGNLPLAICMAAARIATHPLSKLETFASEIDANLDGWERVDGLSDDDVRAVFSWSYDALSPAAARLFRLLGLHPGPDFTAEAAAALAGRSRREVTRLLRELSRLHLVTETRPFRWGLHDLLRRFAADLAASTTHATELFLTRQRLYDHYLQIAFPAARLIQPQWVTFEPLAPVPGRAAEEEITDPAEAIAWFESERSVLLNVARAADRTGHEGYAWQLAWALTTYLAPLGLWHEQRDVQALALHAAARIDDLTGQATAHRLLAGPLARLGDLHAAANHVERSLRLYEESDDIAGLAQSHHTYAEMCHLIGDDESAIGHAKTAVELREGLGNPAWVARSRNTLGHLTVLMGDYETAIEHCRVALAHQEQSGDHNGQAATLDSLGLAHAGLGKHEDAIGLYERALAMWRESSDRYHEGETLLNLGDSHAATSDADAALASWHRAAEIYEPYAQQVADRIAALHGDEGAPGPAG